MERISLSAVTRSAVGKNAVKKVRQEGFVPAILYGRARDPLALSVGRKDLLGALANGRNVLIDLTITRDGGNLADTVMIADVQQDYLRREIVHVDLHQINLSEQLEVDVSVVLIGTAEGVASGGGILEQHRREVTVRCLPTQIPDRITVSVAPLNVGDSLHVRDLVVAEGIEILTPPEEVLAAIVAPKEEEVETPAAAAEGTAAAEPELVGRAAAPAEGEDKTEGAAASKSAKAEK
ncbi:MAG TPA: 50S ribosomal protein L25 [bacterium]|nr:50S ribosomal protein L25 [bacterium]